jgi:methenyltetrahydromethanopterin cyclohydrolase
MASKPLRSSLTVISLNERGLECCKRLIEGADDLSVAIDSRPGCARVVDCGVRVPGGLQAGLWLAEACMAGLGDIRLVAARPDVWSGPAVQVRTDHPVAACMAAQYAGWQITSDRYFAMGSGPMRAARGREELFDAIGHRESVSRAVGVLESGKLPPDEVCEKMAGECGVAPADLTLLVAPTASLAGTIQVVARSVETCLHKLHELKFDLSCVRSGFGIAPLPPVAGDDLAGIGRTNDAVLYGGEVTLWVHCDDKLLQEIGPKIPSSSSPDHGVPFAEVFRRYERDFYRIDPLLFSPAVVTLNNLNSGRAFQFGRLCPEVISKSFCIERG